MADTNLDLGSECSFRFSLCLLDHALCLCAPLFLDLGGDLVGIGHGRFQLCNLLLQLCNLVLKLFAFFVAVLLGLLEIRGCTCFLRDGGLFCTRHSLALLFELAFEVFDALLELFAGIRLLFGFADGAVAAFLCTGAHLLCFFELKHGLGESVLGRPEFFLRRLDSLSGGHQLRGNLCCLCRGFAECNLCARFVCLKHRDLSPELFHRVFHCLVAARHHPGVLLNEALVAVLEILDLATEGVDRIVAVCHVAALALVLVNKALQCLDDELSAHRASLAAPRWHFELLHLAREILEL